MTGGDVVVTRDVCYRETPERDLHLDVYEPGGSAGDRSAGGRPAVVFVHGGAWRAGSKGQLARYALDLAAEGFVAVEANYRLSDEATFPAPATDVKAAVAWLREHAADYGVDSERIAVAGHSAGAHLAALASVTPDHSFGDESPSEPSSRVQAVVAVSGVYDFTVDREAPPEVVALFGGPQSEKPERYAAASPSEWVAADAPPTLLAHGTDDDVVSVRQSESYRETLAAAGVDAELFAAEGGDHVFLHATAWYDRTYERVVSFLRERL